MRLLVILSVLIGIAALACSTAAPAPAEPTPNIDAMVEARLAQERAIEATVEATLKDEKASMPTATPNPTYTPVATATSVPTPTPTPRPSPTTTSPIATGGDSKYGGNIRMSAYADTKDWDPLSSASLSSIQAYSQLYNQLVQFSTGTNTTEIVGDLATS